MCWSRVLFGAAVVAGKFLAKGSFIGVGIGSILSNRDLFVATLMYSDIF
jgi:hypothetical protein